MRVDLERRVSIGHEGGREERRVPVSGTYPRVKKREGGRRIERARGG